MFVGHFSAALVAKAIEPRARLWPLVIASQTMDLAWAAFMSLGIETAQLDPTLPGNPLVLTMSSYSHSLVGAGALAAVGWALTKTAGASTRVAGAVAAVVLSHWFLDVLVHRADMTVFPLGTRFGIGLWNSPQLELVVELGLVGIASAAWAWRMGRQEAGVGRPIALLLALYLLAASQMLPSPAVSATGVAALLVPIVGFVTILARFADRPPLSARRHLEQVASSGPT